MILASKPHVSISTAPQVVSPEINLPSDKLTYFAMRYDVLLITMLASLGLSQFASACSCPTRIMTEQQTVDAMLRDASLVFVGTVSASLLPTLKQAKRGFRFDVQENFKNATSPSIVVFSALSSAECGTIVAPGKTYLVAAYGPLNAPQIQICERPLEVEFVSERLTMLRERSVARR